MITSTCQTPGLTGLYEAIVSVSLYGGSRAPVMGFDSHGVPMDASVAGTQKPADEEVGGWVAG